MIYDLPVKAQEKCIKIPFNVNIESDIITITPTDNNIKHHIILCNMMFGIINIPILFPLVFNIVNKELVSDLFYIFNIMSSNHEFDYIYCLLEGIYINTGIRYTLYKNMNLSDLINVLKLNTNNEMVDNSINIMLNKIFYRVNKYINFCLALINDNNVNISQTSKLTQIINNIKNHKVLFYGTILTIEEHIEHIKDRTLLLKKKQYFFDDGNKLIKIFNKDIENKSFLTSYPNKYNTPLANYITIPNLINHIILNEYKNLFEICCKILYKKKLDIHSLINEILFNDNYDKIILVETNKDILYSYLINQISFNTFKKYTADNFDHILLNKMIDAYTYPISYDKKSLNNVFIKLLYYCFKHSDNINKIQINQKIKYILLFFIKFNKSLCDNDFDIINSNKIYSDIIIYNIMKIIIFNNMDYLIKNINCIKKRFIENIIIINIMNNLSWKNLSKQLNYLQYIINMKDQAKDIIIQEGKINRIYTYNMDNRLKKIILDPLVMFNYMKKQVDFHKWLVISHNMYSKIFYNMISLKDDDIVQLSKILYYYSKIIVQNMDDKYYKKFLYNVKNNNRLVLFNDRINIRFKDIFKNININLGYMARDIMNDENISITMSDEEDNIISKLKRKYYKYKGKYLEVRTSDTKSDYNMLKVE